jgi:hypothetical protein
MTDLISSKTLIILGIASAIFFVASLIAIPMLLVWLPVDYFDENRPHGWFRTQPAVIRGTFQVIKNLIAIVFMLCGIAMLVLPGQGVLTILIGLSMLDFPGKNKLERRIVGRPEVLRTINSIRSKFGKPPLVI